MFSFSAVTLKRNECILQLKRLASINAWLSLRPLRQPWARQKSMLRSLAALSLLARTLVDTDDLRDHRLMTDDMHVESDMWHSWCEAAQKGGLGNGHGEE
eukprot:s256_g14.t1